MIPDMKKQSVKLEALSLNKLNTVLILIAVSGFLAFTRGQEIEVDSKKDSIFRYQGIVPPVEFQYDLNKFFKLPLTDPISSEALFTKESSTIWLRTEMMISNIALSGNDTNSSIHFTYPLYTQFLKDSEFDMVRYVLGMAQLSAVAYMAYRHIKKYGFLK